jgi:hypothetical protein
LSVAGAAFKNWARTVDLPSGIMPLAVAIGVNRTTIHAQLLRGRVRESVIIAAARTVGVNPVVALSSFEEYHELQRNIQPPLPVEVTSQITLTDAMLELISRRNKIYGAAHSAVHVWEDPPQPDGLRNWIDAIDPGHIRRDLSERLGISPPQLSSQIVANKMRPRHLVEVARIANASWTSGLAVGGVITLEEAGWPEDARSDAIINFSEVALNDLVQARLVSAQRGARRLATESAEAHRIEETLG